MKTNKIIAAALIAAAVSCSPKGEGSAETKALLPKGAQIDSVSYLLGVNFGSIVKGYDFGELNMSQIQKGLNDFINAKGEFTDSTFAKQFKIDPNSMNEVINSFLGKRHEYKLALNKEKGAEFLAANAKKEGVVETESGLQYIIREAGNDVKAGPKDTVVVNYKGTTLDGKVFDETPEGAEPVELALDRVIAGWTEGLQLVGEGGEITLYIPSNLAYGERGSRGIEANSALIFDVKVSKVKKVAEAAE